VTIRHSDVNWPVDGLFQIGVWASASTKLTLTVGLNSTITNLQNGQPMQDEADAGDYNYYSFYLPTPCDIDFIVTPQSGDPDIFVSRTYQFPSADNNEKYSDDWGGDTVSYTQAESTQGFYYISVYAAGLPSAYTILAHSRCGAVGNYTNHINLQDGLSTSGQLTQSSSQWYKFQLSNLQQDVTFSISRSQGSLGSITIYATTNQQGHSVQPKAGDTTWSYWYSDSFTVKHDSPYRCTSLPCVFYITLVAQQNVQYRITASTSSSHTTLSDGISYNDNLISGTAEYFLFRSYDKTLPVQITLTRLDSSDPDLFVSTRYHRPNGTHNSWVSTAYGSDSLTIPPTDPLYQACGTVCTFYIAVAAVGGRDSAFTITASLRAATELRGGVPQDGSVDSITAKQFKVRVSPGYSSITITVNDRVGLSKLYVSNTGTHIDPSDSSTYIEYRNAFSSNKKVVISETGTQKCAMKKVGFDFICEYSIAVLGQNNFGVSNTLFTVRADTADTKIQLSNGVAVAGSLTPGRWAYYVVEVQNPNFDLTVLVTPLSGDPDLYASQWFLPNLTYWDKRSMTSTGDFVDFERTLVGHYYFGVYAYPPNNASYTIMSVLTSPVANDKANIITLSDGIPQNEVVHKGHWKYYLFNLVERTKGFTISVSSTFGDPDIYVIKSNSTAFPDETHYGWASTSQGSDTIRINNPETAKYWIGIKSFQTAMFSLVAATDEVITTLQSGIAVRASLSYRQYRYYKLHVDADDRNIMISVTAFSGDPDVYVSTHHHRPNSTNYQWKADSTNSDTVAIIKGSANACSNCDFYIAVYAFSACDFSLLASFADRIQLLPRVASTGNVVQGFMQFYSFHASEDDSSVTFNLVPTSGNPQLFVSTRAYIDPVKNASSIMWKTNPYWSGGSITITNTDNRFCAGCDYYLAVLGVYAATSTYILTGSETNSTIWIQDGVDVYGTATTSQYRYFRFSAPNLGSSVIVTVTPITGDPDLYVSYDPTNPYPNANKNNAASEMGGADAVAFRNSSATTYYISVLAWNMPTTFYITAYSYDPSIAMDPLTLVPGQPRNDIASEGEYKYYHIILSDNTPYRELTISVTKRVGDPDLFVNNNGQFPTQGNARWSAAAGGSDIVRIANPQSGDYIIGVLAFSTSVYSIVATTDLNIQQLQNGVPVQANLQYDNYHDYLLPVDTLLASELVITVTSSNGDPDIFVSTSPMPRSSQGNYNWSAESWRDDSITLTGNNLFLGTYYISVYAASENITYSVVASFTNSTYLLNGQPQSGVVAYHQIKYYTLELENLWRDLTVSVTTFSGWVYLYVSRTKPPVPSDPTSYQWSSTTYYNAQFLTLRTYDDEYCYGDICTYHIAVYGQWNSNFLIVAAHANSSIELQSGSPYRATLAASQAQFFSFEIVGSRNAVNLQLNSLSDGDPDLYVSTSVEHPDGSSNDWASNSMGNDNIHFDYTHPKYEMGIYYVSVINAATVPTTYTLLLTIDDTVVSLIDGQPQTGVLSQGTKQRYEFIAEAFTANDPITITVTPLVGDPDVYVTNSSAVVPTWFTAQWTAAENGRDVITISPDDPSRCKHVNGADCVYSVVVYAFTDTSYSVIASTSEAELQSGVSQMGSVKGGKYAYYNIFVDHNNTELVISLTALSGDPDLLVAYRRKPTFSDNDAISLAEGTDVIQFDPPGLKLGHYIIGVFGWGDSNFIISATLGGIRLIESEPHSDLIQGRKSRHYSFIYNPALAVGNAALLSFTIDPITTNQAINTYITNVPDTFPNSTFWRWRSIYTSVDKGMIVIPGKTDPNRCTSVCTFYITVESQSYFSVGYVITAVYGETAQLIQSGKPVASPAVLSGEWRYYRAIIPSSLRGVTIVVIEDYGKVEVFASQTVEKPNAANSTWTSGAEPGARGHSISIRSGKYAAGLMYIGVHVIESSQFQIVLTTANTILSDGKPYSAYCMQGGQAALYVINVDQRSSQIKPDIKFHLDSSYGHQVGELQLYISTNASEIDPSKHSMWSYPMHLDEKYTIKATDTKYCAYCSYFIAVGCARSTPYTITVSTGDEPQQIYADSNTRGSIVKPAGVTQDIYDYYTVPTQLFSNFSMELQPCTGKQYLYASQTEPTPNSNSFQQKSELENSIQSINLYQKVTTAWYIGVRGLSEKNSYLLTTTASGAAQVKPKVPSPKLSFPPNDVEGTIKIQFRPAVPANGDPQRLIYSAYVSKSSNEESVLFTVCGVEATTLVVEADHDHVDGTPSLYYMIVEGLDGGTGYDINILVTETREDKSIFGKNIYAASSGVYPNKKPEQEASQILSVVLGVGIPILIIFVVVIIYLFTKNRKLTQELSIEMHDVPKAAVRKAVRDPARRGSNTLTEEEIAHNNWNRLLDNANNNSETDIDPVSSSYRPPSNIDEL
jgi:hypothetical protein